MSPDQRRFLILDQTIGTGLITAAINAGFAWLAFRQASAVPLWGINGIVADLAVTLFLLPFLVCVISTPIARKKIQNGSLQRLDWRREDLGLLGKLPTGARRRGLVLSLVCMSVLIPAVAGGLLALNVNAMSPNGFLVFKATYTGVLAAIVGPLVGIWALLPVEHHGLCGVDPAENPAAEG